MRYTLLLCLGFNSFHASMNLIWNRGTRFYIVFIVISFVFQKVNLNYVIKVQ